METKIPKDYPPREAEGVSINIIDILGILAAVGGLLMDGMWLLGDRGIGFGVIAAVLLCLAGLYGNYKRYQFAWFYWGTAFALVLIMITFN